MMIADKTAKLLLAAIAVAVWISALNPWIRVQPVTVAGQVEVIRPAGLVGLESAIPVACVRGCR